MGFYPSGTGCAVCAPVAGATQVKCYNGNSSLPVACTPGLYVDGSSCSGKCKERAHTKRRTMMYSTVWGTYGSLMHRSRMHSMHGGCERDGRLV
jgi:hypothetical protein